MFIPSVFVLAAIIDRGRTLLDEQEQRVVAEILVDFEQGMRTQSL